MYYILLDRCDPNNRSNFLPMNTTKTVHIEVFSRVEYMHHYKEFKLSL